MTAARGRAEGTVPRPSTRSASTATGSRWSRSPARSCPCRCCGRPGRRSNRSTPAERDTLRRAHGAWRDDVAAGQRRWVEFVLRRPARLARRPAVGRLRGPDRPGGRPARARHDGQPVVRAATDLPSPVRAPARSSPTDVRLLGPAVRPGAAAHGPDPGIGVGGDPGRSGGAAVPPPRRPARPGDRRPLVGAGLGAARRRDDDRGVRRRGLAGGRRPRRGARVPLAAGAPPVLRGARRRAPALRCWKRSEDSQEDLTEALGVQVRQAVELLVTAIGRADAHCARARAWRNVTAHEVYRGAVSVMMRVVFLLFAEERRLLPSDNELYAQSYSAGRLGAELEQRAREGSENELENSTAAWHRLLALFTAVHDGIEHPRLTMHAHDGSLFDPDAYPWLPRTIDDRTVLHMLRAVQHVWVGTGAQPRAAHAVVPPARRRADRLRLRGPAVVRGLPGRRGGGRPGRQAGPGGGGRAHRAGGHPGAQSPAPPRWPSATRRRASARSRRSRSGSPRSTPPSARTARSVLGAVTGGRRSR